MQPVCHVVGAGDFAPFSPKPNDFIIAADGGFSHLQKAGIAPDLLIGDFDSLSAPLPKLPLIQLPKEKDDTDMIFALKHGLEKGFSLFHLHGGTGGRMAHTMANLQSLAFLLEHGAHGFLFGKEEIFAMIQNESLAFPQGYAGYLSVFSYSDDAFDVSLSGLYYPLQHAHLTNAFPLGTSNAFLPHTAAKINVGQGKLLLCFGRFDLPLPSFL